MNYIIAGLGNTGEEYTDTRHNIGRMMVEYFHAKHTFSEWSEEKKKNAQVSKGKIGRHAVTLVLPELLMNRSGAVLKHFVTSKKKAATLVVVYDDLDLGFGTCRVSFSRGSGGHRGVESISKSVETKDFIRVRVGISPTTSKGVVKKPHGEQAVLNFVMGKFTTKEQSALPALFRRVETILETIITQGHVAAMNQHN